jgi:cellulose synthase/poly-beta-1,6-N-acetylglucosamine synthase-like glycosyltransferase
LIFLFIISLLCFLLITGYSFLLQYYQHEFSRIIPVHLVKTDPQKVSVIIPARNEENNIGECLDSILSQDYPKSDTEIIVADDHSTDNTASIARSRSVKLLDMKDFPAQSIAFKKKALSAAITSSGGDLIITTDADCITPQQWIKTLVSVQQNTGAVFIVAPVRMRYGSSFLSKFQSIDFAILQGITAAGVHAGFHNMANGANLAYSKEAYNAVNGFSGIDDIASGDDMLLMQKISEKFPGRIAYAFSTDAIVDTMPEPDWKSFFAQRIRWASKARKYKDKRIFRVLLLVYLLNVFMLVLMCISFLGIIHFSIFLLMLGYKTIVEWGFVRKVLVFFSLEKLIAWFVVAQPIHIFYTVISGLFGQAGSYQWKGRQVK